MEYRVDLYSETMPTSYLRPREKIITRHVSALTDHELIQAIVGSGSKGTSVETISRKILKLIRRTQHTPHFDALQGITGVGPAKAALIVAAFELASRYIKTKASAAVNEPILERDGMYCRYMTAREEIIDERWYPPGLVQRETSLLQQLFSTALKVSAAKLELYDNSHCRDSLIRLQVLLRHRRVLATADIIGIPVVRYWMTDGQKDARIWKLVK